MRKLTGPSQLKPASSKFSTRLASSVGPRYSAWKRTGFLIALKFNGQCSTPLGMKTTVVEVMVCFSSSFPIHRSISASKLLQRSGNSAPRKMRNSSYLCAWGIVSQQTGAVNTCQPIVAVAPGRADAPRNMSEGWQSPGTAGGCLEKCNH